MLDMVERNSPSCCVGRLDGDPGWSRVVRVVDDYRNEDACACQSMTFVGIQLIEGDDVGTITPWETLREVYTTRVE